jgi:four helix bundle protein
MEEELKRRMLDFSVAVIRTVEALQKRPSTEIVGRQLIRCASAIGANYRAACRGKSRADFIAKLAIAEEEADESQYWLEILVSLGAISEDSFRRLHREAGELTAILVSSIRTARQSLQSKI